VIALTASGTSRTASDTLRQVCTEKKFEGPRSTKPESLNPPAAAAAQELVGSKFGEMSTLVNYTFQSFDFRGKRNTEVPPVLRSVV
jgi:Manganese containing catalase